MSVCKGVARSFSANKCGHEAAVSAAKEAVRFVLGLGDCGFGFRGFLVRGGEWVNRSSSSSSSLLLCRRDDADDEAEKDNCRTAIGCDWEVTTLAVLEETARRFRGGGVVQKASGMIFIAEVGQAEAATIAVVAIKRVRVGDLTMTGYLSSLCCATNGVLLHSATNKSCPLSNSRTHP